MITLGGSELARLNSDVRGVAWLIALDFSTGMLRLTTAPMDVIEGGNTYTTTMAAGGVVSPIEESADTGDQKVTLSFTAVDSAMIAAALGDVHSYRNRAASMYFGLFDDKFQLVGNKTLRWAGKMERVTIRREGTGGSIEMACSRVGVPRSRVAQGRRMSDSQQQRLYTGDRGLEYIQKLIEKPALWLSKEFQKQ